MGISKPGNMETPMSQTTERDRKVKKIEANPQIIKTLRRYSVYSVFFKDSFSSSDNVLYPDNKSGNFEIRIPIVM